MTVHDIAMWLAGGLAAVLAPILGVIKKNRDRSIENHRALYGDQDDPNTEGVLEIVYDTRSEIRELRREMAAEHHEVMQRLDDDEGAG